jgi:hypothetical protein
LRLNIPLAVILSFKGDLQAEDIIPRSPSPSPVEDRKPNTSDADEARELRALVCSLQQDNAKIKFEFASMKRTHSQLERSSTAFSQSDQENNDPDVKFVAAGSANKRARAVEVVNLTED